MGIRKKGRVIAIIVMSRVRRPPSQKSGGCIKWVLGAIGFGRRGKKEDYKANHPAWALTSLGNAGRSKRGKIKRTVDTAGGIWWGQAGV